MSKIVLKNPAWIALLTANMLVIMIPMQGVLTEVITSLLFFCRHYYLLGSLSFDQAVKPLKIITIGTTTILLESVPLLFILNAFFILLIFVITKFVEMMKHSKCK